MATERLQVILEMVAGQYKREAREAAKATGSIAEESKKASKEGNFATRTFSKWGDEIKTFVALQGARAIGSFVSGSIEAAKDLNESINAVGQVFGSASEKILDFGEIAAQTVGLSNSAFNQMSTFIGAALTNAGFSMDEAANQAIQLTTRAGDLASVFNTDVSTAVEAISSSLAGQQRPLRQFGINLSDAEIRAKAVELGLAKTTAAVDDHGKAVATLELIYKESAAAAGDFLRTSDDLANAQRIAAGAYEDAQARFGKAAQAPLAFLADAAAELTDNITALGLFGEAEADVARQSIVMADAVKNITEAFRDGKDPLTALADSLLFAAENGELTVGQFEALAAAAQLPIDKFDEFAEIVLAQAEAAGVDAEVLTELEAAITGSGDAAGGAAGDHEDLADALEGEAEGAGLAATSQRDLISAYREAANPIFAAQRALDRYRNAQEALAEAQADGKSTAEDIAEAQLDVASAALEAEDALLALGDGDIERGIAAIATALDIGHQEARKLLETLGILDGSTTTHTVDVRFAASGSRAAQAAITGTSFANIGVTGVGALNVRQHGGPVSAMEPYVIGERGPEIFVPQQSGYVISNADISRLISGITGGGSTHNYNIPIQSSGNTQTDAQLVGAVASVLRRMESL